MPSVVSVKPAGKWPNLYSQTTYNIEKAIRFFYLATSEINSRPSLDEVRGLGAQMHKASTKPPSGPKPKSAVLAYLCGVTHEAPQSLDPDALATRSLLTDQHRLPSRATTWPVPCTACDPEGHRCPAGRACLREMAFLRRACFVNRASPGQAGHRGLGQAPARACGRGQRRARL